jgi:N-acetylmuramoyl-L-alanine amidase
MGSINHEPRSAGRHRPPPASPGRRVPSKTRLALTLAALSLLFSFPSGADEEKHIAVFSPVAIYSLPVLQRSGHEYVGILELLEPLGRVSSDALGTRWKLVYNSVEADFVAGKTRARVRGRDFELSAPFLIENSRGLVPLSSLSAFLPRFLGTTVSFHESGRRLLIGDVAVQISFHTDSATPQRLTISFSAPVTPVIAGEPGRLRLSFTRDPVISPGTQTILFDSHVIPQANYSEKNGDAQLEITSNEPVAASLSRDRKAIVVSVTAAAQPPAVIPAQSGATGQNSIPPASPIGLGSRRVLAVVDAAHGGDERGAALTDALPEKDVTIGLARLLRHELETRNFAVLLLRDTDTGLSLDQRAGSANAAHAGIYINLHATTQGSGARIYTALLPVSGPSNGVFHAWNSAQTSALPISRMAAAALVAEMRKRGFPARSSPASLRPLNNVFMPALAVELAPSTEGASDLTSANYQQQAAAAIADALASIRDRLGAQP